MHQRIPAVVGKVGVVEDVTVNVEERVWSAALAVADRQVMDQRIRSVTAELRIQRQIVLGVEVLAQQGPRVKPNPQLAHERSGVKTSDRDQRS
jgi:copper chaperone CopZ